MLLTGFSGVLIVTNPGVDAFQIGALFALANAIMYGSVTVAVRGMTATESANTLLMWQMVTMAVCHSLLLLFGFRWPTRGRRGDAGAGRRRQCCRAICLDQGAAAGAGHRGVAVLLSDAGLGDGDRLRRLGRRADDGADHRLGDRGRVGLFLLWHEAQRR